MQSPRRLHPRWILVTTLIAMLSTSCSGPGPTHPTSPPGSSPSLDAQTPSTGTPAPDASLDSIASLSPGSADDPSSIAIDVEVSAASTSLEVQPEQDAIVEATGPDGSMYRLALPAFSLAAPSTITLRPLTSADVPGGAFLAGVEIEPSGTQLRLPATLTIIPAAGADAASLVALEYTGSGAASAKLGALVALDEAGEHGIILSHFSGGVVGSLDSEGEQLWLGNKAFNTSTVAGRKAQAEHNIRVIEWSERNGRISEQDAKSSITFWQQQWWEAEADGIASDPVLQEVIDSGDLTRINVVTDAVAEMIAAIRELERIGDSSIVAAKLAEIDIGAYSRHAVDRLRTDSAFQQKLGDGQIADMANIQSTLSTLIGLARGAALAADEATSDYVMEAVAEFIATYVFAIADACRHTKIDTKLHLQLVRLTQLMERADLEQALRKCDPLHFIISAHYEAPLIDMTTHTVTGVAQLEDLTLEGEITVGFIVDGARGAEWVFEGLATHTVDFLYPPGANAFNAACSEFGAERWTGTDVARVMLQSGDYAEVKLSPDPNRSARTNCDVAPQLQPYGFTLLINIDGTLLTHVDVRAEATVQASYITATVQTH